MATRFSVRALIAAFLFSLSSSAPLSAQEDWPNWLGESGTGAITDSNLVEEFSEDGPPVVWRQPIGPGYTGPSVENGRLFVMDRTDENGDGIALENGNREGLDGGERVMCLDANTGEEIWSHNYDCPYTIQYPNGPRCTPTCDGDHVYTLGAMGHLICFKSENGEIVWEKNLADEYGAKPPIWGYASHPVVDGDNLLVPAAGEGSGAGVVALNKMTGEEIWRAVETVDVAYAPLVFYEHENERQLIFWHSDGISSLNPETGEEFWNVKFPEEVNPSNTSITTPAIIDDLLMISEFYKGAIVIELDSNPPAARELWRTSKQPAANAESLNSLMSSLVHKDGYAYGVTGLGHFRCLEIETGDMQWTVDDWMEPGERPVMFATAFLFENEGRYFVFNDIGELMIIKLSPEGMEEISRAKILEPTSVARGRQVVWSHPAAAGGMMYLRNDAEIVCLDLRK
ncbi:MAG: PQQ-binding-like beta-propeller repeat protein [Planctomycetota bacterium]